jgi:serine phosphatase RsbU (regulator of sigma subunit)
MLVQAARDQEHLRLMRALDLGSLMIVPMLTGGRVLGVVNFANSSSGHVFDESDLELAQELARRAAIAIDNARVHAELRHTARTLQESLLPPHLPAIDGVEVAARFRPAGTGLEVGGDFYDIFDVGDGRWGIVIGDVCGKGANAAAVTALARYTVRAAAMYEKSAGGVLGVLNEALLRQRTDFRFTTLGYALLDLRRRPVSMRVATGGHPHALVRRADGSVSTVGSDGPLLGVIPGAEFREAETQLAPGDAVVFYTDGLTDARAPEHILDEVDLVADMERNGDTPPTELVARLEALATEGLEGQPRDDIAILALRLGTDR